MKCRFTEADIALFVEGDLPEVKALEVQAHLTSCRQCSELAADLRETQAVFKSLKQDLVSSAAAAAVRTRVLAEVSAAPRPWWGRWVFAVAGSVFVLVVSVLLFQSNRVDVVPAPLLSQGGVAATSTRSREASADGAAGVVGSTTEARIKPGVKSRVTTPSAHFRSQPPLLEEEGTGDREPQQIVVKLLTEDPDVVIYWLVDGPTTGGTL